MGGVDETGLENLEQNIHKDGIDLSWKEGNTVVGQGDEGAERIVINESAAYSEDETFLGFPDESDESVLIEKTLVKSEGGNLEDPTPKQAQHEIDPAQCVSDSSGSQAEYMSLQMMNFQTVKMRYLSEGVKKKKKIL